MFTRGCARAALLIVLAIGLPACASAPREGSTSPLVRYAYFSRGSAQAARGLTTGGGGLPAPAGQFDAVKDDVYFIFDVRSPSRRDLKVRWQLFRPDGLMDAESETVVEYLGGNASSWMAMPLPMASLKSFPGTWRTTLFVETEEVGRYQFTFGDAQTIARVQASWRRTADAVAGMLAPAQGPRVRLQITGPPGAEVKINDAKLVIASTIIDTTDGVFSVDLAPGTYVIEVTKSDFEPWRETVTLRVNDSVVEKTARLTPR